MVLAFMVGQRERHRVVFRFDKFWGNLSITVDGRPVVRDFRRSARGAPVSGWPVLRRV